MANNKNLIKKIKKPSYYIRKKYDVAPILYKEKPQYIYNYQSQDALTLNQAVKYINYKLSIPVIIQKTGYDNFLKLIDEIRIYMSKNKNTLEKLWEPRHHIERFFANIIPNVIEKINELTHLSQKQLEKNRFYKMNEYSYRGNVDKKVLGSDYKRLINLAVFEITESDEFYNKVSIDILDNEINKIYEITKLRVREIGNYGEIYEILKNKPKNWVNKINEILLYEDTGSLWKS